MLLNLAPLVAHAHGYTAERLVTVVVGLCGRVIEGDKGSKGDAGDAVDKDRGVVAMSNEMGGKGEGVGGVKVTGSEGEGALGEEGGLRDRGGGQGGDENEKDECDPIKETLAVLLQFIDTCLRPSRRLFNVDLVYALIYDHDRIVPALRHPAVVAAVVDRLEAAAATRTTVARTTDTAESTRAATALVDRSLAAASVVALVSSERAVGGPTEGPHPEGGPQRGLPLELSQLIEHYYSELERQDAAGRDRGDGMRRGGVFNSSSIGVSALHNTIVREQREREQREDKQRDAARR